MAFSQAYITGVNPPIVYGTQLLLSWTSTAPSGTWYQVYVGGVLIDWTTALACEIPLPTTTVCDIVIGSVGPGEQSTSFASSLPATPLRQVELTWFGGTYESATLAGFYVYGESSPGSGINYTSPTATVEAYPGGIVTDGFGYGGFGEGGFGSSAASYSWTSGDLVSGTWHFAVAPFDAAGNVGTPTVVAQTVEMPPCEPAPFLTDGLRLHYTYSAISFECTLLWNPSPC